MSSPDLLTRRLAVEIFDAVLRHNKGLEDEYSSCMERQEQSQPLENRDRTFVRLLVTVMLRRLGQIDDIIRRFLKNPCRIKPAVSRIFSESVRLSWFFGHAGACRRFNGRFFGQTEQRIRRFFRFGQCRSAQNSERRKTNRRNSKRGAVKCSVVAV